MNPKYQTEKERKLFFTNAKYAKQQEKNQLSKCALNANSISTFNVLILKRSLTSQKHLSAKFVKNILQII